MLATRIAQGPSLLMKIPSRVEASTSACKLFSLSASARGTKLNCRCGITCCMLRHGNAFPTRCPARYYAGLPVSCRGASIFIPCKLQRNLHSSQIIARGHVTGQLVPTKMSLCNKHYDWLLSGAGASWAAELTKHFAEEVRAHGQHSERS